MTNYIDRWFEDKRYVDELKMTNTDIFSLEHQEKIFAISLFLGLVLSGTLQGIYGPYWFFFNVFKSMVANYLFSTAFQMLGLAGAVYPVLVLMAFIKKIRFVHAVKKLDESLEATNPMRRWLPDPEEVMEFENSTSSASKKDLEFNSLTGPAEIIDFQSYSKG